MNKDRRKQIEALAQRAADLQELAESLKADIESVRDDEQDYYDSMPEPLQGGDKGQAAESAVSELENAIDAIDSIDFGTLSDSLSNAAN